MTSDGLFLGKTFEKRFFVLKRLAGEHWKKKIDGTI